MRLRSSILLACMLVVPALAMFSHKMPPGARRLLRQRLWEPLCVALADAAGFGAEAAPAAPTPRGDVAVAPTASPAATAGSPSPAVETMFPAGASHAAVEAPPRVLSAPAAPAPGATPGSEPPEVVDGGSPFDRAALEARLRALGATGVEWDVSGEDGGGHRCTCRLPADPTGQLERVFQASASDPLSALEALIGQVTAWSARHGSDARAAAVPSPRRNR